MSRYDLIGMFLYALLGVLVSKSGLGLDSWQFWAILVNVICIEKLDKVKL